MIGFELCFLVFKIVMFKKEKKYCEHEVVVESAAEFTVESIFQQTNENLCDFFSRMQQLLFLPLFKHWMS